MSDSAGFLFGFEARQQAHSQLCNCWRNAEAGQKDQQDGIFFDRNRLKCIKAGNVLIGPSGSKMAFFLSHLGYKAVFFDNVGKIPDVV